MLREWNTVQTNLGELFALLVAPKNVSLGFAIWNAIRNDRQQRAMLLDAAPHTPDLKDNREKHLLGEIRFVVEKANDLGISATVTLTHSWFLF